MTAAPRLALATSVLVALASVACGAPPTPRTPAGGSAGAGNPLGPSYVLIPLPTEDDALLGRILPSEPAPGRSLEETARANPCADKLSEPKTSPTASSFEDAQEVRAQAGAKAMLGAFGFSGDMEQATHFVYKLETSKRIARQDTADYAACCAAKGCGYGYVSALVYGEGEYATGEETRASGQIDVLAVGGASGGARVKVLHRRKVKGWLAAVVTVTDAKKGEALGPLGVAQAAGITEAGVPETVKKIYEREKIDVTTESGGFRFVSAKDGAIKENEFVRRFRKVTGSDELDDIETRRNKGSFYTAAALTAVSAGLGVYGFLNLTRPCSKEDVGESSVSSDCVKELPASSGGGTVSVSRVFDPSRDRENDMGTTFAIVGTAGTLGFGIWLLAAAFGPDGSATEHLLGERDAVLYTSKYNRALLRRTITDVQKTQSSTRLHLTPTFGMGTFGLTGRF